MKALGFDFEHGSPDESLHPFCGGTYDDIRLTTRYDESDFSSALMGVCMRQVTQCTIRDFEDGGQIDRTE